MIDEYKQSSPPIKLTKEKPLRPIIPRNNFEVVIFKDDIIKSYCMRFAEKDGISYAITYWDCPHEILERTVIYKCSECKMVTWIEIDS